MIMYTSWERETHVFPTTTKEISYLSRETYHVDPEHHSPNDANRTVVAVEILYGDLPYPITAYTKDAALRVLARYVSGVILCIATPSGLIDLDNDEYWRKFWREE